MAIEPFPYERPEFRENVRAVLPDRGEAVIALAGLFIHTRIYSRRILSQSILNFVCALYNVRHVNLR